MGLGFVPLLSFSLLVFLAALAPSTGSLEEQERNREEEIWNRNIQGRQCILNSTLGHARQVQLAWEMGTLSTLAYVEWADEKYQRWPDSYFQVQNEA